MLAARQLEARRSAAGGHGRAERRGIGVALSFALALEGCSQAAPVSSRVPSGVVPAKLVVTAPAGAEIHVDGVQVGTAPLESAIAADPGPHQVAVVLDGHAPALARVTLERGKQRTLDIELETTAQRKAAWAMIAFGGAGVVSGIVLGALAVVELRKADDIARGPSLDSLDPERFEAFTEATDARDRYRIASGVTAGAGIASFVTGAILYAFDDATLPSAKSGWLLVPLLRSSEVGFLPMFHTQW